MQQRLDQIADLRRMALRKGMPEVVADLDDAAAFLRMRETLGPRLVNVPDLSRATLREFIALIERHGDSLRVVGAGDSAVLTVVLPRLRRELESRR